MCLLHAAILERVKMEFKKVAPLDPEKVSPLFNKFSCSVFSRKNRLALCSLNCFDLAKSPLPFAKVYQQKSVRENAEFNNTAKFGNLPHYPLLNSTALLNS